LHLVLLLTSLHYNVTVRNGMYNRLPEDEPSGLKHVDLLTCSMVQSPS